MKRAASTATGLLAFSAFALGAVPATNNPAANFVSGMFLLPDLADPKDAYLIIVEPKGGDEATQLSLPPGSTGLRVSIAALPQGEWTWKYKLSRQTVPAIQLETVKQVALSSLDIPEGRYSLAWRRVDGAKRYVVAGQSRTKTSASDEPTWSKLEATCFASVCARNEIATKAIELKPGSEVKWSVSAVDEDGIVLAKSEEAHIQVENTWVQAASKSGFKLQRSDTLSKATATLPATLTYLSNQKDAAITRSTAYQTEFALIYEGPNDWGGFWPRVSLEGKLTSTGDQKSGDALKFRAGGYQMLGGSNLGEGTEFVANLKYETERKTGTKKGVVELGFTPIYGWLGRYWPGPPKKGQADAAGNYTRLPWLQVAPVVSLGVDLGKTMEVGTSQETKDTIVRLRTTLRLDAELNAISYALGTNNVTAYLEGSYWRLPKEDGEKNYRLGKTGLTFGLTDYLSFDLAYTVGREAPTFKFTRTGSAGFGLKF